MPTIGTYSFLKKGQKWEQGSVVLSSQVLPTSRDADLVWQGQQVPVPVTGGVSQSANHGGHDNCRGRLRLRVLW